MTKLADFTIEELMIFCATILGALGVFMSVLFKSKCKEVSCCCIKCIRDVSAVIKEEKISKTGHSGDTPRLSPAVGDIAKEPEVEEP